MEEPLLQDKRREHNRFCQFANELIEKIVGKPQASNVDASLDRIRRVRLVLLPQFYTPLKFLF